MPEETHGVSQTTGDGGEVIFASRHLGKENGRRRCPEHPPGLQTGFGVGRAAGRDP